MHPSAQQGAQPARTPARRSPSNPSFDLIVQSLQAKDNNWPSAPNALGITASAPGEGVTTVATNLAITAATSTEGVLLVDANFQRPGASRMLRMRDNVPGLLEVLHGDAELSDCIRDTKFDGVSLLSPGLRKRRGSWNTVSTESLETLIDHLKYEFPLIIFDLPSTDQLGSSMKLAGILDGLLLVVSSGRVPREHLRRATDCISRCGGKVMGIVLNKSEG